MKHAPPETVKQRVIAPEVINEVSNELKDLESEVKAVQREEKEEKEVGFRSACLPVHRRSLTLLPLPCLRPSVVRPNVVPTQ